ncbi:MAG: class I adenylate-forming enzyme family protein [Acidimicrobiia bacterium]
MPTLDALLSAEDPDARVRDTVARAAGGLRALGVRRGDVVAWQLPNGPDAVLLYRACWRLGAIAGPIHHQAGSAEVARMLEALAPKVVVEPGGTAPLAEPFTASMARPSDLAVALFTGGSTGVPKRVLHTHRGLSHKATTMVRVHGLDRRDAVLMPAPLAHVSGLLNGVLVPGAAGMRSVPMARWDPERALEIIETERITFMVGPPTFFVHLMAASGFSPERVGSLRLVSSGGAGVTPAFVAEATERLGARVKRSYGSTEAPTVTSSTEHDSARRAAETDGRPVGECELRIEDDGELWLRGPELFAGYADAVQTREAVTRGWFATGDLATVDEDGWLTIVGRKQDVIIRGGENIAAAEVEDVLVAHPAIREAAAVGYPDVRLGERVCAFVVSDAPFDLEACRRWFAERGLARFKTPERVVRVDALPVLAAGKVDRAALRKEAAERC